MLTAMHWSQDVLMYWACVQLRQLKRIVEHSFIRLTQSTSITSAVRQFTQHLPMQANISINFFRLYYSESITNALSACNEFYVAIRLKCSSCTHGNGMWSIWLSGRVLKNTLHWTLSSVLSNIRLVLVVIHPLVRLIASIAPETHELGPRYWYVLMTLNQ